MKFPREFVRIFLIAMISISFFTCVEVWSGRAEQRGFDRGYTKGLDLASQNAAGTIREAKAEARYARLHAEEYIYFLPIGPQLTSEQAAKARRYNDALLVVEQNS